MTKTIEDFSREDLTQWADNIESLLSATAPFRASLGSKASPESLAGIELSTLDKESVLVAHCQGNYLLDVAVDQTEAFVRTLAEPSQSLAPWTCARSVLESSSLSIWFLDPTVRGEDRVRRAYAFRYEGLEQQVKWGRSTGAGSEERVKFANERIDRLKQQALALGIHPITNRSGQCIGLGQRLPSVTEIIRDCLARESEYRLFSAVAHCHA